MDNLQDTVKHFSFDDKHSSLGVYDPSNKVSTLLLFV